jgi:hypothetical protein
VGGRIQRFVEFPFEHQRPIHAVVSLSAEASNIVRTTENASNTYYTKDVWLTLTSVNDFSKDTKRHEGEWGEHQILAGL